MKKTIETQVYACENCDKADGYSYFCSGCGKDYCIKCFCKFLHSFKPGVHFSGMDLHVCDDCFQNPPKRLLPALTAYLEIKHLREELERFHRDFNPRRDAAEKKTEKYYDIVRLRP